MNTPSVGLRDIGHYKVTQQWMRRSLELTIRPSRTKRSASLLQRLPRPRIDVSAATSPPDRAWAILLTAIARYRLIHTTESAAECLSGRFRERCTECRRAGMGR